jgi:hypothetical protein
LQRSLPFQDRRAAFLQRVVFRLVVFPATFVIGVTARAGIAHLQKLSRHVGADKLVVLQVGEKHCEDRLSAALCNGWRFETPVRSDFAFVGLADKDALLAFPHAVTRRAGAILTPGFHG